MHFEPKYWILVIAVFLGEILGTIVFPRLVSIPIWLHTCTLLVALLFTPLWSIVWIKIAIIFIVVTELCYWFSKQRKQQPSFRYEKAHEVRLAVCTWLITKDRPRR